jgi:hypothetical protein
MGLMFYALMHAACAAYESVYCKYALHVDHSTWHLMSLNWTCDLYIDAVEPGMFVILKYILRACCNDRHIT